MKSEANKTQVGGNHYKKGYEHWDFAVAADLPYLEGVITKYLDRYFDKNGKQDLEKAEHYVQKLTENVDALLVTSTSRRERRSAALAEYLASRPDIQGLQKSAIFLATTWASTNDLEALGTTIRALIDREYPPGPHA